MSILAKKVKNKFKDELDEENEEVPQNFVYVSTSNINTSIKCTKPRISVNQQYSLPDKSDSEEYNWQAKHDTVRERNAVMFNNPLMADIFFNVGKKSGAQRIPAHKYILATGSSVFMAMLYGGLATPDDADISIPDVEPYAFLNLLRYLYIDEIQLSMESVLGTLYAAKKYLVPNLARACVSFLENSLTSGNACLLLCQARLFEESDLVQRCWEVIDAQAEDALSSEAFTDVDSETFSTIISRETLNINEITVFNAAQRWAEAECARRNIEDTPENLRYVLGSSIFSIRLPSMTITEFANGPAQSQLLSLREINDIFLYFTADNKPQLDFNPDVRLGLLPLRVNRFQSSAYRPNQWRYRGRCDSIQFSVDRRIFIVGFGLYGSSNGPSEYQVKIELKRNGIILGKSSSPFLSDGSCATFSTYFDSPLQIEPDTFYTASAMIEGTELSYFGQEGLADVQHEVAAFQFQCSSDSTNGTGVQGGQIPELIFYA